MKSPVSKVCKQLAATSVDLFGQQVVLCSKTCREGTYVAIRKLNRPTYRDFEISVGAIPILKSLQITNEWRERIEKKSYSK